MGGTATQSRQLEALAARVEQVDVGPAAIYVQSVEGCPYTCAMCTARGTKPVEISSDILAQLEPYFADTEIVAIHGNGEPLLGDLDYFVRQAETHGFVLHMNTTGFFLTRRVAELLLRARLSIRFSIHAATAKTYDRIMGQDFARVLENVAYLAERAAESEREHDLWFSYIVMRENLDEIDEFLRLARRCGVGSVRFMKLSPNRQTVRGATMKDRDFRFRYRDQYNRAVDNAFREQLPHYRSLAADLGIRIEFGTMEELGRNQFSPAWLVNRLARKTVERQVLPLTRRAGSCVAPWIGQLIVRQDGSVNLCCNTTCRLGSLKDSSLGQIWNSPRMRSIRRSFAAGRIPRVCGYCTGFGFGNYPNNAFPQVDRTTGTISTPIGAGG